MAAWRSLASYDAAAVTVCPITDAFVSNWIMAECPEEVMPARWQAAGPADGTDDAGGGTQDG